MKRVSSAFHEIQASFKPSSFKILKNVGSVLIKCPWWIGNLVGFVGGFFAHRELVHRPAALKWESTELVSLRYRCPPTRLWFK